jgi:hypothetical protein
MNKITAIYLNIYIYIIYKMGKTKWAIGGNEIYSDNKFMIKKIKMSQLISYYNSGIITIPDFQREIDEEKVKQIYKTHKKKKKLNENWIIQQCCLTICVIELTNKEYKLYLIDGQHRLLAIKDLIKKNIIIDEEILIQMKKCNSIKEMKKYFKTLNINSKIEIQYHGIENEFYNSLICNFKSKIKSLFLNAFSRTKNVNKTNQFLHIDQFLELFKLSKMKNTKFVEGKDNTIDIELLLENLVKLNLEIKVKYDEIKLDKDISDYLYKSSITRLKKSGFYLSLKNVEWFDYFIGQRSEFKIKPQKIKKIKIPKKIRIKVWEKRFDDMGKGECYCCKSVIDKTEFHAGHINSEFNGGTIDLDNLEPICPSCNSSMGTMNMNDYKDKYYPTNKSEVL